MCVVVSFGPDDDPDELIAAIQSQWQDSVQAIWLSEIPWGTTAADSMLLRLGANPRVGHATLMALRSVDAQHWLGTRVEWVGDASVLMREKVSIDVLAQRANSLPFRPELRHVVVRDPAPENLASASLNQVYWALQPDGFGWLYVPEKHYEAGARAVMAAKTPWGVRRIV